jgi:CSLREA domain-containing protein
MIARRAAIVLLLLASAASAGASTIVVTSTADVRADDSECTLREAVIAANTNAPSGAAGGECVAGEPAPIVDTILLQVAGSTPALHTLSIAGALEDAAATGDLDLAESVEIRGRGADETVVEAGTTPANGIDRVFDILPSTLGTSVSFIDLTIRHGRGAIPSGGVAAFAQGAGIYLRAVVGGWGSSLTLHGVRLTANTTEGSGGGIAANGGLGTAPTAVTIERSEISSNTAFLGGAGIMCSGCDLRISDSAVVSNIATVAAGAGHGGGGIRGTGDGSLITLINSTVGDNRSFGDGGGLGIPLGAVLANLHHVTLSQNRADADVNASGTGGALFNATGIITFLNSIVAQNIRGASAVSDCFGAGMSSGGYNVLGAAGGCASGETGDIVTANAALSALDFHGGKTRNYVPLAGSPALERIVASSCTATADQRGYSRPRGPVPAFCESGAVENTAPDVRAADLTIAEDAGPQNISFTVDDIETPDALSAAAASSNQGLLPDANLVLSGSGRMRTLTATSLLNQFGAATITLTTSDGNISSSIEFVLTVTPVNDLPTITAISPQSIDEDTATNALAFTVADVETAAGSLVVTGSSSDTTVVPNGNVTLGGSDGSRTVVVAPAANQFGESTITISASDGTASTSTSFLVTVASVNDEPTVSDVADQSIMRDSTTGALSFTIGDVETSAPSLTLSVDSSNATLVPSAGMVLGGSATSRTVTVTPAIGQSGTATISLHVSDGDATTTRTFELAVAAQPSERVLLGFGPFPSNGGWLGSRGEAVARFAHRRWLRVPWAAYNATNGEVRPAVGNLDADPQDEVVIGLGNGGGGYIAIFDDAAHNYALVRWIRIEWPAYVSNAAGGSVWPAVGDLDGDGRAEIVAGLGPGSGGWVEIFDDATADFAHLAWRQLDWAAYNTATGETHPAVADLDGNGRAEIILGLAAGGAGRLQILEGMSPYASRGWVQVNWAQYTQNVNGPTFPAAGDVDGDGRSEIVLGLGNGGQGWLQVLDDAVQSHAHLKWLQVDWAAYNTARGETHPAVGNVDGDPQAEIAVGLGQYASAGGWVQVFEDALAAYSHLFWMQTAWQAYIDAGGGTFPAVGRFQ